MRYTEVTRINHAIWLWRAEGVSRFHLERARGEFQREFHRMIEDIDFTEAPHLEMENRGWVLLRILVHRLQVERYKTTSALIDVELGCTRPLPQICAELNDIVATVVGYQQAATTPPLLCNDPVVWGRVEERIDCFLEEVWRTVQSVLQTMGDGQCPLAWDERTFNMRPGSEDYHRIIPGRQA